MIKTLLFSALLIASSLYAEPECKEIDKKWSLFDWEWSPRAEGRWQINVWGGTTLVADCENAELEQKVDVDGEAFSRKFRIVEAGLYTEYDEGDFESNINVYVGKFRIFNKTLAEQSDLKEIERRVSAEAKRQVGFGPASLGVGAGVAGYAGLEYGLTLAPTGGINGYINPFAGVEGFAKAFANALFVKAEAKFSLTFLEDKIINRGYALLDWVDTEPKLVFGVLGKNELKGLDGKITVEVLFFNQILYEEERKDLFSDFGFRNSFTIYDQMVTVPLKI